MDIRQNLALLEHDICTMTLYTEIHKTQRTTTYSVSASRSTEAIFEATLASTLKLGPQ